MNLKKTIFILFISLVSFSCTRTQEPFKYSKSLHIEKLNTIELKKEFLENIYQTDQKVRNEESSAVQYYGYKSNEHKMALQKMIQTDSNNFVEIMNYLSLNKYPDEKSFGEIASMTPWLIFHHYPYNKFEKEQYNILSTAYKKGLVSDSNIEWFLRRKLRGQNQKVENFTLEELIRLAEKTYN